MKILLLSYSDIVGGANIAAFRLLEALIAQGADATMVVQYKRSEHPSVHTFADYGAKRLPFGAGYLDKLPKAFLNDSRELFSLGWMSNAFDKLIHTLKPDIVHLHWTHSGIVSIPALARCPVPIVWTLHDMWAMTGGCHYSGACRGFESDCRGCPLIKPRFAALELARRIHARKRHYWARAPLQLVTPSHWMASEALASSLFANRSIATIPYSIDTTLFDGTRREEGRTKLGLAPEERAILFVNPNQERKGRDYIPGILAELHRAGASQALAVVFLGGDVEVDLPIKIIRLPRLRDAASIAAIYAACDVMVLPSLGDNLPNVIIEAHCSGTPVAAFGAGGIPEMIPQKEDGEITAVGDAQGLAQATLRVLAHTSAQSRETIRRRAHATYARPVIARQHLALYETLLSPAASPPEKGALRESEARATVRLNGEALG